MKRLRLRRELAACPIPLRQVARGCQAWETRQETIPAGEHGNSHRLRAWQGQAQLEKGSLEGRGSHEVLPRPVYSHGGTYQQHPHQNNRLLEHLPAPHSPSPLQSPDSQKDA